MGIKTHIKFSPKILARLGEELNQSPSQGIIELVKNAHDADAPECIVELNNVTQPGGSIQISDRGDGMDIEAIEKSWLVLGSSSKDQQKKTKLGRTVAGNKGLGRLSALRLGTTTSLTSITAETPDIENSIEIDWNELDKADAVEDVELEIETIKYQEVKPKGSLIIIDKLRNTLSKTEVKKLARSLILLSDPFTDDPKSFRAKLVSAEFKELEELVSKSYFEASEFYLHAELDEDGKATAVANDCWGNELYRATHENISDSKKNNPIYNCPPTKLDIWIFLRSPNDWTLNNAGITEVKNWLDELGGVQCYLNGLRVSPYGDKGDDWLGLNLLRVKNPELRPATNSCVGKIVITDEKNNLKQKTDRSGFIEDDSYTDLREFARDALEWLAKIRVEERDKKRGKERRESEEASLKESKAVEEVIETLEGKDKEKVKTAFRKREKQHEKLIVELKKEIQLYRTLSTAGITAAVFAHESANNPIKLIAQSMGTVRGRCKKLLGDIYDDSLKKPVERIFSSIESLRVLGNVTLSLVSFDKRKVTRLNVHDVISAVKSLYEPFLKDRKATLDLEFDSGNPFLRGSIAALESIITNLINNSLVAFENVSLVKRTIVIRSQINPDTIDLIIMDNGPGIDGISIKDLWLPGQTTNSNGTGLGMTIVKDAVEDLNGTVEVIAKGEMGGAEIRITLPIIGS